MRRAPLAAAVVSLALPLLLASCGNSSGPKEETPDDYVGDWKLAVQARAGCWPAFEVVFEIDRDDAAAADSAKMNIVAQWWFPADPAIRANYSGKLDWTGDAFDLRFTHRFLPVTFSGPHPRAGSLAGTFTDRHGAFQVMTGTLPCVADARATRL